MLHGARKNAAVTRNRLVLIWLQVHAVGSKQRRYSLYDKVKFVLYWRSAWYGRCSTRLLVLRDLVSEIEQPAFKAK